MSGSVTVTNVHRAPAPDDAAYQAYVDVMFSTGITARHAIDQDGGYLEQVFDAEGAVLEENYVEEEVNVALEEFVIVWIDTTMDLIEAGASSWDVDLIRNAS
jgi:hypothetical protein